MPISSVDVARQSEPGAPFINTWLLLGTFDNDAENTGYNRDFIGEATAAPQDGATDGGQKWRYFDDRLFSRNYDDYNDLFSYFSIKQKTSSAAKVVYAHSYVYSPAVQDVQLRVGADTSFKAWINGAAVVESNQAGPTARIPGENQVLNGGRDFVVVPATLTAGWNRLLLKIANQQAGRFGFFARFTTSAGEAPRGLEYSVGGGSGALTIENSAMPEAQTGTLPIAWREWPYVKAQPDAEKLREMGAPKSGPGGQKAPELIALNIGFRYNAGIAMSASAFKLSACGGQPPLVWSKIKGDLPSGMTLESDGTLGGTPAFGAKLDNYAFTVQVCDAAGKTATREYSLTLRERPNRKIESERLVGLIHGPERVAPADVPKLARQMKRQGFKLGMPVAYHNGDLLFRWPTKFSTKQTPTDQMAQYRNALEAEGIDFGMYFGPVDDVNEKEFTLDQQVLVMQEALELYRPKALWMDWLGGDSACLDSLFSVIRSIDPNIVIIMNGAERPTLGDWDIIAFEGWAAWGRLTWNVWPTHFPWPKKNAPLTWRASPEPEWVMAPGISAKWDEMLRTQLSLIGEGFIADIDHSASITTTKTGDFETWPLVAQHERMADWASPQGLPPLHEAYTDVDPGPLPAASWGYNTMNLKRDAVYLLALQNPRLKTGLPTGASLNVGAISSKVKSVTLMNENKPLSFSQDAQTGVLSINTQGVTQDQVATIIKIALETPLPAGSSIIPARLTGATSPTPEGNIATNKPAWLMSADGTRELTSTGGFYANFGTDGAPNTFAQASLEYAWSFKVDLQQPHTIRRIGVLFDTTSYATEYAVLISLDGEKWKRVLEVSDGKPGAATFNIAPVETRWVRLQALKPDGPNQPGSQMSVGELQVFETELAGVPVSSMPDRGGNLASRKPAKLLTRDGTGELEPSTTSIASNGVDGNLETWAQASGQFAWTYQVDLEEVASIRRIAITFGPNLWASEYGVCVSRDGQQWIDMAEVRGNTSGGMKTHAFTATQARYVRVQAIKPDGPNQAGAQMTIAELQVFDE